MIGRKVANCTIEMSWEPAEPEALADFQRRGSAIASGSMSCMGKLKWNDTVRKVVLALFMATTLGFVGCAGYRIGTKTLYRTDVRTIHVPIIKSDSFRPELGVMLTESIQKEIERRTPFKLANVETAESIMTCRLTSDSKRVVSETNTDEPRLIQSVMTVEVSWVDRRGMPLIETRFLPPGETTFYFAENVDFIPEAGQSISTANQRAVERLANHIVDQMETRW